MEKHRLYHCLCWKEIRSQIPEELSDVGAKSNNVKDGLELAKRHHETSLEVKADGRKAIVQKWESDKHRCWYIPARSFRDLVATDGLLLGEA